MPPRVPEDYYGDEVNAQGKCARQCVAKLPWIPFFISSPKRITPRVLGWPSLTSALTGPGSFSVGLGEAALTSPTPGGALGISTVTFTWTVGYGVSHYNLWLGLTGPASSDLYTSGNATKTSAAVASMPVREAKT